MPQTTAVPMPAPIESHRLDALSSAVTGVVRDRHGRAPADVRSLHFEEHVITILQDGPAPGRLEDMSADFVRAAERALGRKLLGHRSSIHPESKISFEIFRLAGEIEAGRGSGGLYLVGGTEA